jgi:membrane protease subunit HflC
MKYSLIIVVALVVVLWVRTAFYTVDAAEFVYVTRFGNPVAVHDGGTNAGLHFKAPWPIDSTIRIDRRVQSFDLPAVESLTRDPTGRTVDKTIAVDVFVTWKIPDQFAADRFVRPFAHRSRRERFSDRSSTAGSPRSSVRCRLPNSWT